jgi:hypothetical protein
MKFITIILGLFAVSSITSCRVQTSPSESATADVTGLVVLDSGMFLPTPSGVTVSLEGTNFSAITDDSGRFELMNVPGGTYTVRWSKPGYGDVRYIGVAIQGGGNTPVYIAPLLFGQTPFQNITTYMSAFSHVAANFQSASFSPSKYSGTCLVLDGSYTDDEYLVPGMDAITAFFSHKKDVSPIEGHYDSWYNESGNITELDNSYEAVFDTMNNTFHYVLEAGLPALRDNFHSGDSLYVAVYGTGNFDYYLSGDYFDPTYNEGVITSYNQTPSRVIGLKIP